MSVMVVIRKIDGTDVVWTVEGEIDYYVKIINHQLKPMGLLREAKIYRKNGRKWTLIKTIKGDM